MSNQRRTAQTPASGPGRRENADRLRLLAQGKLDCIGEVTLTAGATSTVVSDDGAVYATEDSVIVLSPRTANAAAALASGALYFTPANGSFTIHHPSTADVDKTFGFAVIG